MPQNWVTDPLRKTQQHLSHSNSTTILDFHEATAMNLRYRGIQYQRTLSSVKSPEEIDLPESVIPQSSLSSPPDLPTLQLYKTVIVVIVALMAGVVSLVT